MEIQSVVFHRAAYRPADFPRDGRPQFAIVGRSNVGKSSLINTILHRKNVARVSQTPGKTQAIQFYLINEKFHIVDLPGYGYAKVPQSMRAEWRGLMESYFVTADDLQILFLLLDSRRVPSEDDLQMHEWARESAVETRFVLTKTDKLSNNELAKARKTIREELGVSNEELIAFSKVDRRGADKIWKEILSALGGRASGPPRKTEEKN